ncbi:TspO/MBR family protein [Mycolicibacterium mageritense]|uniref:TspO/MBR family protein n=1 Tax=Mycolicibacterium mageritense TaxID=53462 RepID=UPI0011D56901|nr:TspO/MBR family protein [Mycolicibacterium mageritense]TXI62234.1 MAG: tryptophan-rich sensory protein [Mycolicibacterium mageritense]
MRPITLTATAAATLATALVGGLASRPAASPWYAALRKPSFQPPRQAFPVVWPLLYTDIAVTSAATLEELHAENRSDEARAFGTALAANLVMNAGWSWIFFSQRRLGAAAVAAAALTVSSADLTRRVGKAAPGRGAALAPYPLWCAFATLLSTRIWMLNRGRQLNGLR